VSAPVAVLVSGTGRHLENFARLARAGELDVDVVLALSNREGVAALDRARRFDVPALVLDPQRELDDAAFGARAFEAIEAAGATTVLLAGFLRKLDLPERWLGRVLNIHPALLPAFGGKGYWGDRVHAAVLERGVQFTGCTVHVVDDVYDNGRLVLQRVVPVRPDDTVERLAARVFEEEKRALPEAIGRALAERRPAR
jgi:phosphoribosylglycinamide formyltransferase-1